MIISISFTSCTLDFKKISNLDNIKKIGDYKNKGRYNEVYKYYMMNESYFLKTRNFTKFYGKKSVSIIPMVFANYKFRPYIIYLYISEVGGITAELTRDYKTEELDELINEIKKMREMARQKILPHLRTAIQKELGINKPAFKNNHVTSIFIFKNKEVLVDEFTKKLIRQYGKSNYRKYTTDSNISVNNKNFNLFVTNYPPKKKKGRKNLRVIINQAIHHAHLINQITDCIFANKLRFILADWVIILYFLNPFVISGKTGNELYSNLFISWFSLNSKSLKLYIKFINMLKIYVSQHANLSDLLMITHILESLRSITMTNVNIHFNLPKYPSLSNDEEEIIKILTERHKLEVSRNAEILVSDTNFKYGRGLTMTQIVKKMGYYNGRATNKIYNLLNKMIEKKIIDWMPYTGPGSRDHSKLYFINSGFVNIRKSLINLIDNIFKFE